MSNDSFSEVTSQSWLGRLGSAIKGVLFGLLLFAVSFPLLWWNEGRAVRTAKGLKELAGSVVSLAADRVDAAHDKRPVHMTAEAASQETLADPDFPISITAVKLRRKVEMYQWKENKSSETKKKLGGGSETKTTWTYDKRWSSDLIDSDGFKHPAGHANPRAMRFPSREQTAKVVTFGAFHLSPGLVSQMNNYEPLPPGDEQMQKLTDDLKRQVKLEGGSLYLPNDPKGPAADPKAPQIGDLRIQFEIAKPATVSIIARQLGDSFEPWQSQAGTQVERLAMGEVSQENMVGQMEQENTILTWVLRLVGFLLMAFGIGLVVGPVAVFADVLPLLGDLLRMGIGLFAGVIAACLSLLTIAVAWLAYRPLLAVALIVAAVVLVIALKRMGRRRVPLPPLPK
jgi:hypothetical protein